MHIAEIFLIRHGYVLSVSDNAGQNAEDLIIGNAILLPEAVIPNDHIVVFSDFNYTISPLLFLILHTP